MQVLLGLEAPSWVWFALSIAVRQGLTDLCHWPTFSKGRASFPGSADAKTGKADSQSANVTLLKMAVKLGFHLKAGVGWGDGTNNPGGAVMATADVRTRCRSVQLRKAVLHVGPIRWNFSQYTLPRHLSPPSSCSWGRVSAAREAWLSRVGSWLCGWGHPSLCWTCESLTTPSCPPASTPSWKHHLKD